LLGIREESQEEDKSDEPKDNKEKDLNEKKKTSNDEEESSKRKAFLDLLLDHHLNGGDLSEEGIREEVDTFMFEGHDTTSMALSWIIFLLGHHPHVQEKLWSEIDALFEEIEAESTREASSTPSSNEIPSSPQIPLSKLKDLKYLDCVVKEGLRLCPSVPFIGRRLHEEMKIKAGSSEYTLPSGCIVYVFIYMLHRDAETFPSPEVFNPDRFLPENSIGRNPFAFVPFSAGKVNSLYFLFLCRKL
jgi:cytochrome P450